AASFAKGSVVMIARAASLPPLGDSAAAARLMAAATLRLGSFTPITAVEATRTASVEHPTAAAVRRVISRAWLRPSAPVQALAQPLLTTTGGAGAPDVWHGA